MTDKAKILSIAFDPTPTKGAVSGGIGVGMQQAQGALEGGSIVFGMTIFELAAAAAFAYSAICILLAMPKLLEMGVDFWNRWMR